jgi:hypothetical protein
MARDESAREDLMREATALSRRIELEVEGEPAPVIIGFRRDGAASVFFGDNPVIQFNARGELRRGFVAGRLIKAERCRLVGLTRVRTQGETQLLRHELDGTETAEFLRAMQTRLVALRDEIEGGRCRVLRQVPDGGEVLRDIREWLSALETPLGIAATPRV